MTNKQLYLISPKLGSGRDEMKEEEVNSRIWSGGHAGGRKEEDG